MIQSPCYTCDKCPCKNHDGCPDYAEYKSELEELRKENMKMADVKDYVNRAIAVNNRKRRYRR